MGGEKDKTITNSLYASGGRKTEREVITLLKRDREGRNAITVDERSVRLLEESDVITNLRTRLKFNFVTTQALRFSIEKNKALQAFYPVLLLRRSEIILISNESLLHAFKIRRQSA